jgi:hypothetical protein
LILTLLILALLILVLLVLLVLLILLLLQLAQGQLQIVLGVRSAGRLRSSAWRYASMRRVPALRVEVPSCRRCNEAVLRQFCIALGDLRRCIAAPGAPPRTCLSPIEDVGRVVGYLGSAISGEFAACACS